MIRKKRYTNWTCIGYKKNNDWEKRAFGPDPKDISIVDRERTETGKQQCFVMKNADPQNSSRCGNYQRMFIIQEKEINDA